MMTNIQPNLYTPIILGYTITLAVITISNLILYTPIILGYTITDYQKSKYLEGFKYNYIKKNINLLREIGFVSIKTKMVKTPYFIYYLLKFSKPFIISFISSGLKQTS